MGLGNVEGGGTSNVKIGGPVGQTQKGSQNTQDLQVGNVKGNGTSGVYVQGGITQQPGRNEQYAEHQHRQREVSR